MNRNLQIVAVVEAAAVVCAAEADCGEDGSMSSGDGWD
jgi:hypothetical protein